MYGVRNLRLLLVCCVATVLMAGNGPSVGVQKPAEQPGLIRRGLDWVKSAFAKKKKPVVVSPRPVAVAGRRALTAAELASPDEIDRLVNPFRRSVDTGAAAGVVTGSGSLTRASGVDRQPVTVTKESPLQVLRNLPTHSVAQETAQSDPAQGVTKSRDRRPVGAGVRVGSESSTSASDTDVEPARQTSHSKDPFSVSRAKRPVPGAAVLAPKVGTSAGPLRGMLGYSRRVSSKRK